MNYYFVSTDHFVDNDWFRDDEDYSVGMNYVAVDKIATGMTVLAFVLMSNHLHFVLQAERETDITNFWVKYKQLYATYVRNKYGIKEFLRRNQIDIQKLPTEGERLERTIAYTVMNPVAARICATPDAWRWGSGGCYFNRVPLAGKQISEMSMKQCMRVLHSKVKMAPKMGLAPDGVIWPQTYVETEAVEKRFRTPARFSYFLNTSTAAKNRPEQIRSVFFRDQTVLAAIPEINEQLFGTQQLDREQTVRLARELRQRFHSDARQLARVLGLRPEAAAELWQ